LSDSGRPQPRPRILFYAAYDASRASSGPLVRIRMLSAALAEIADVHLAHGSRFRRLALVARLVLGGQLRASDAVYIEPPTAAAMPWDILLAAAARAMGRPVGIYFRDAYQLFRDIYPAGGWRVRLSDLAWRLSTWSLRRLATVAYVPSSGLASALHLRDAVLLPPGTDPSLPNLGAGEDPCIAYVGAVGQPSGTDRLMAAMELVRREEPDARLLVVGQPPTGQPWPDWVEFRTASREALPGILAAARACAIPRPINTYTDLAWPIKLADYLSLGKPLVATRAAQTAEVLTADQAAILVGDEPASIAEGLLRVLRDRGLADRMAARARAMAEVPAMTWSGRATTLATTILERH